MATNGTGFNVNEFDFAVPVRVRQAGSGFKPQYDGYATVCNKGRTRKTNNRALSFTAFTQKSKKHFDNVAIGKWKKGKRIIAVFNNADLPGSAPINNYKNKTAMVGSSNHTYRLFEMFNIEIPVAADAQITFQFHLTPDEEVKDMYTIEPFKLIKIDGQGRRTEQNFRRKDAPQHAVEENFEFEN